jgi:hypothetical protein
MSLCAIHYFMSRIITLTSDSARELVTQLRSPPELPISSDSHTAAKLINLPLKQVMQGILNDEVRVVLQELDNVLESSTRNKGNWANSFCAVLLLLICVEAVQVATDGHISMALIRDKDGTCKLDRIAACRELDDRLCTHIIYLFHAHYKSCRARTGQNAEIGFNPFRHQLQPDENNGITQEMVNLVEEIKQIRAEHGSPPTHLFMIVLTMSGASINKKSQKLFNQHPDILTDHIIYRKRNSGRLVLRFLDSFLEQGKQ